MYEEAITSVRTFIYKKKKKDLYMLFINLVIKDMYEQEITSVRTV